MWLFGRPVAGITLRRTVNTTDLSDSVHVQMSFNSWFCAATASDSQASVGDGSDVEPVGGTKNCDVALHINIIKASGLTRLLDYLGKGV